MGVGERWLEAEQKTDVRSTKHVRRYLQTLSADDGGFTSDLCYNIAREPSKDEEDEDSLKLLFSLLRRARAKLTPVKSPDVLVLLVFLSPSATDEGWGPSYVATTFRL